MLQLSEPGKSWNDTHLDRIKEGKMMFNDQKVLLGKL